MELLDVYRWYPAGDNIQNIKIKFLYRLLSQREPHQNISHREMPTWDAHVNFVNSCPYAKWYIIVVDNLYVGAIYLTKDNEIGIFIDRRYRASGFGAIALNKLIKETHERPLYANIAPDNYGSQRFFKRQGFMWDSELKDKNGRIVQYTFVYNTSSDEFYGLD